MDVRRQRAGLLTSLVMQLNTEEEKLKAAFPKLPLW